MTVLNEHMISEIQGDTVSDITKELCVKLVRTHPILVLLCFVLPFVILGVMMGGMVILFAVFPIIIFYGIVTYFAERALMMKYASLHGFTYDHLANGLPKDEIGILFEYGRARKIVHCITGTIALFPSRLFSYSYQIGSGKHTRTVKSTVLDINLPFLLPRIYFEAYKSPASMFWVSNPHNYERLSLESNEFEKRFSLYVQKGEHLAALQIFTPDFIQLVLELDHQYSMEIAHQQLYMYEFQSVSSIEKLNHLVRQGERIANELTREFGALHRDRAGVSLSS
jgi:hypothetical protein